MKESTFMMLVGFMVAMLGYGLLLIHSCHPQNAFDPQVIVFVGIGVCGNFMQLLGMALKGS